MALWDAFSADNEKGINDHIEDQKKLDALAQEEYDELSEHFADSELAPRLAEYRNKLDVYLPIRKKSSASCC